MSTRKTAIDKKDNLGQKIGHMFINPSAIIAMIAFFLPWLNFSCVGSGEQEVSAFQIAYGVEVLGEFTQDGKYWVFLISPIVILLLSLWCRHNNKPFTQFFMIAGGLLFFTVLAHETILVADFYFSDKPPPEEPLYRFMHYYGYASTLIVYPITMVAIFTAFHHEKKSQLYLRMLIFIFLIASINEGYLVSDFLLDDTPPPMGVDFGVKNGLWMAMGGYFGIMVGCVVAFLNSMPKKKK